MKQAIIQIDLGGVNCYIGKQGNTYVLFDTGGHTIIDKEFTNRRELLVKKLDNIGCDKNNLKLVVLTHGDNDHVANAAYIKKVYNAKIAMHGDDVNLVQQPDIELVMKSFNYRSIGLKVIFKCLRKLIKQTMNKILDDYENFTPDVILKDGDSLIDYGFDAKIIHTPGHTPGSIAILTKDKHLIVGDTLTGGEKIQASPNAIDFSLLNKSVNKLIAINAEKIYVGHGQVVEK